MQSCCSGINVSIRQNVFRADSLVPLLPRPFACCMLAAWSMLDDVSCIENTKNPESALAERLTDDGFLARYGILLLVVEMMGATTVLMYGLNLLFQPVEPIYTPDLSNPGLPKVTIETVHQWSSHAFRTRGICLFCPLLKDG